MRGAGCGGVLRWDTFESLEFFSQVHSNAPEKLLYRLGGERAVVDAVLPQASSSKAESHARRWDSLAATWAVQMKSLVPW